jgi:hypothetical protein
MSQQNDLLDLALQAIENGSVSESTKVKYTRVWKFYTEWLQSTDSCTQKDPTIINETSSINVLKYLTYHWEYRKNSISTVYLHYSAIIWYYQYKMRVAAGDKDLQRIHGTQLFNGNPGRAQDLRNLLKAYKLQDRDRVKKRSLPMTYDL